MKVKYIKRHSILVEDMFCGCFISFGLLLCVHSSNIFKTSDACLNFSKKEPCRDSNTNITCTEGLVMITLIVFGGTNNNKRKECCLDTQKDPIIDVSDGQYDGFIDYILANCLFRQSCSLPVLLEYANDISIRYRCIPEKRNIDPCETKSYVLNIGETYNVFMRRTNQFGACGCVVNGSTEMTIQDFFTIFDGTSEHKSKSVLRLDGIVYDSYNNSNIVHSDIVHTNVSSLSITFDGISRRLWLSVNITGNATQIWCSATSTFTTPLTTITKPANGATTPAAAVESTTNETEITVPSIEKNTQPLSQSTDTAAYTSDYLNSTFPNESTSLIVYVVSGSAAVVVVVVMVVGGIVFLRHRRRIMKSTMTANTKPNIETRSSAIDSLGEENFEGRTTFDNENACQTVTHIPHITKGSVKYAVVVPPDTYNYAFVQNDKNVLKTFRSKAEQTGSSQSDGEGGLSHPYFRLHPLNEQSIGATADGLCTDERGFCSADGDMITEQPIHVYNHITFGRGTSEVDNDIGLICSDEYSHISNDDNKASVKGRYYNIFNINAGRSEPADDYCHIGSNNANLHAHVTRDDYNHVVL